MGRTRRADLPERCGCGSYIDRNRGGARELCATCYQRNRRLAGRDKAYNVKRKNTAERRAKRIAEKTERRNALREWRAGVARRAWLHSAEYASRLRPVSLDPEVFVDGSSSPSTVAALSVKACRDCGCPPTFGVCPVCGPRIARLEGCVSVLPIVEVDTDYYSNGRFAPAHKPTSVGRTVMGELVLGDDGFWREAT